mgnify:CR=1 FL=1
MLHLLGQLAERVKRQLYCIILLDEIEKAHPDLFNILLQVFEDGHLTDGLGNRVNFKNAILIMTSNIGARFIQKRASLGFQSADSGESQKSVQEMVLGEVKRTFNPEFINRIDELIVFEALTDDDLRRIMELLVAQLNANLVERKLQISLTPDEEREVVAYYASSIEMGRPMIAPPAAPAAALSTALAPDSVTAPSMVRSARPSPAK